MAIDAQAVRLTAESYDLLRREAGRRGLEPDALAEQILRAELDPAAPPDLEPVLSALAELRAQLPDIDGLALTR